MESMKRFVVRCSCEYSEVVEARTAREAIERAKEVPPEQWESKAWSADEAEEEPAVPGSAKDA
jgi:hypothetical protein